MGPVTVAHLLYIFLHNWIQHQSLEKEEVSGMFQWSQQGFAEVSTGESLIVLVGGKKHF